MHQAMCSGTASRHREEREILEQRAWQAGRLWVPRVPLLLPQQHKQQMRLSRRGQQQWQCTQQPTASPAAMMGRGGEGGFT